MQPEYEQTRMALPGNRGIFTHPNMRPRTVGGSHGNRTSRYAASRASEKATNEGFQTASEAQEENSSKNVAQDAVKLELSQVQASSEH